MASDEAHFRLHRLSLDESHNMKSRTAARSCVAQRLLSQSLNVWLLSVTPVTNDSKDIFVPLVMMGLAEPTADGYRKFQDQRARDGASCLSLQLMGRPA